MHCNSCVSNIRGAVEDLPGTFDIQLTYEGKVATIDYDPQAVQVADITKEIEELGFKAIVTSNCPTASNQDLCTSEAINNVRSLSCIHLILARTTATKVMDRNEQPINRTQDKTKKDGDNATCFLQVEGMTCASCVDSITRNLSKVKGKLFQ